MAQLIKKIEQVTSQNKPVYIGAGNDSNNYNLLGLAQGATNVGGTVAGQVNPYFSYHSDIQRMEESVFFPVVVDKGYDLDGNGCADVPLSEISSKGKLSKGMISGTSFSTPLALGKDLK
ncbi:MAG: hypothetical protein MZU91_05540 [Desulfosudis oleivorans]|nr:hypothetical protein [Desulfosudis oleivorans]